VRVYATQSTHKTLTSLRQGSMIHVNDQDFKGEVEEAFHEAYMTHTSTSPNYQIIASLDVGRGRWSWRASSSCSAGRGGDVDAPGDRHASAAEKYFKVLTVGDMIPEDYRAAASNPTTTPSMRLDRHLGSLGDDEFVLDATRVTLMGRRHRLGRRHVQDQDPDGQARHPDQQDLAQHRAVHDQYRHDAQLGRLSDRGAGRSRPGAGRACWTTPRRWSGAPSSGA
jgi:hypothetical protein